MIESRPPLLARLLLTVVTPRRNRPFLIRDLAEEFGMLLERDAA